MMSIHSKIFLICLFLLFFSPYPLLSQDFCQGNFDYDQDVDGSDAFVFKLNFGRNMYVNSCPPDGPAPVSQTGQSITYSTSDDGDIQSGISFPQPRV